MRCFLAVDIPEELKKTIIAAQQELTGLDTKLVEKENLHFTLKFLDEVDEGKMKDVVKRIDTLKAAPFPVLLKGIGFFPSQSFIRVVWIGAESPEFLNLHVVVNDILSGLFEKEKPVPHLTLARVRSQSSKNELLEFQRRHENRAFGEVKISRISLKKSVMTQKGPLYENIKTWDFHDN